MTSDNQSKPSGKKPFYCPCCGYRGPSQNPYSELDSSLYDDLSDPPHADRYDYCSHEGCHCCGYEFGHDDNIGACGQGISLRDYRKFWIKDGCRWFHGDDRRPKNWNIATQMAAAGIPFEE